MHSLLQTLIQEVSVSLSVSLFYSVLYLLDIYLHYFDVLCKTMYYGYIYTLRSYGIVLWKSSKNIQHVFINKKSLVSI